MKTIVKKFKKLYTKNIDKSINTHEILFNKNKYIGKYLQVQFYEYTKTGKPFHIIDTVARDYE